MAKNTLKNQEIMQKNVAFYQVLFTAWMSNRMEKDKQIVTLSALAVGLLMTFRSEINDIPSLFIVLFAGGFFTSSMIVVLVIFKQNSDFIMLVIRDNNQKEISQCLHLLLRLQGVQFLQGEGLKEAMVRSLRRHRGRKKDSEGGLMRALNRPTAFGGAPPRSVVGGVWGVMRPPYLT